ncbi:unnamed protein product [Spirodela intermedia]|uniref:Uncharacterized protein n=1 Tax=Spirodela intermedia TaxID=51605 RepID=A0A7I8IR26_SPIIN|nr:unnamed protein product [Spirodela intermedia]CAA6659996.1 unnamed protein product [Spirodela intermedia]
MSGSSPRRRTAGACDALERVERLAAENAVVIFSVSTCCMCHAVKRLFCGMGVNPTGVPAAPRGPSAVPVVFVGGKLVGAMDSVMASHISGTLVPLLKEAGALWL